MRALPLALAALLSGCALSWVKCSPKGECSMNVVRMGFVSEIEKQTLREVFDKSVKAPRR